MIPILMYHQIGTPPPKGTRLRGATVHPKRFAQQMRWLKRFGYTGLSLQQLTPYLKGEKTGKVFGITFDDGYVNVYENALPVLKALGFSSTHFIVTAEIGGQNHWAQKNGSLPAAMMNTSQLRDWVAQGQEIGSHTVDHVYMSKVDRVEGMRQLIESKETLESLLQQEITSFCYPYGAESLEARHWVQEAGYQVAVTTERGLATHEDDRYALPRVNILRSTHLLHFLRKTLTSYEEQKRRGYSNQR